MWKSTGVFVSGAAGGAGSSRGLRGVWGDGMAHGFVSEPGWGAGQRGRHLQAREGADGGALEDGGIGAGRRIFKS